MLGRSNELEKKEREEKAGRYRAQGEEEETSGWGALRSTGKQKRARRKGETRLTRVEYDTARIKDDNELAG